MRTLLLLIVLLISSVTFAQTDTKTARVGFLATDPATAEPMRWFDAFRQGLREHGWEEGRNLVIESRRADGQYDRLDMLASELVRSQVNVIVTDSTPASRAVMKATKTIPIVLALVDDPVGTGLVASLSHPGGNVTGLTLVDAELNHKRLELLKELSPKATRVAVLWNPDNPSNVHAWKDAQKAAQKAGVKLLSLTLHSESELTRALDAARSWRPHALWVFDDWLMLRSTPQIARFASEARLPTMFPVSAYVHEGGFLSYGPSFTDQCRRSAIFVDKLLRGAKAADLPIEQPTKFELAINLETAKALGLKVPESLILRADEVVGK